VILDSLKDMATTLTDDAVGSGLNAAMQKVIAAGIDVAALHHQRKRANGKDSSPPKTLDDVYGSVWLTAGAGSVVLLWPTNADRTEGELIHLKTPIDTVALRYRHHHAQGVTEQVRQLDVLQWLRARPEGATASDLASALAAPSAAQDKDRRRAKRLLDGLVGKGLARIAREAEGDGKGGTGAVYVATSAAEQVL
jgi:replicative DNA helicase